MRPVIDSYVLLPSVDRMRYLLLLVARAVVQTLDLVGLFAVGVMAAMLASGLNESGVSRFLGVSVSLQGSQEFLYLAVGTVCLFVAKSAVSSYLLRLTTRFLARVETNSSVDVMRGLFTRGLSRLDAVSSGEQVWISTTSSHLAFSTILFAGSAVVTESFLFLLILAGFIVVDFETALLVAAYFLIVVGLFQVGVSRRLKRLGERLSVSLSQSNNAVLDLSNAFKEISVAGKLEPFIDRFAVYRSKFASDEMLLRFVMGLPRFFVEVALMFGFLAIIFWQFAKGELTEGLITTGVFLTGGMRMMAALLPLQNAITEIRTRGPEARRAQEILRELGPESSGAESTGHSVLLEHLERGEPLGVNVSELEYSYSGSTKPALRDVEFTIQPGQFAAIVGPSGSGKTTLADLLMGLRQPSRGNIQIGEVDSQLLSSVSPGSIAYVPQHPGVIGGTLAENVSLEPDAEILDEERVLTALAKAGLSNLSSVLPAGIHTRIGDGNVGLSGGQAQRLGIARALYTNPRILVMDEATSALDAETEAEISNTIRALSGKTTVIVIAHRLSTIQHADLVIVLEDGQLSAKGTFGEVRRAVPRIEKFVQLMKVHD